MSSYFTNEKLRHNSVSSVLKTIKWWNCVSNPGKSLKPSPPTPVLYGLSGGEPFPHPLLMTELGWGSLGFEQPLPPPGLSSGGKQMAIRVTLIASSWCISSQSRGETGHQDLHSLHLLRTRDSDGKPQELLPFWPGLSPLF